MPNQKPNIIYIVADQWRGDCLGIYDNSHPVMTPHLNQLAAEGINFSNAYADCPICMPQRITMLTGRTGSQLGCLTNFATAEQGPEFDKKKTLPARLAAEAGYQTKAIGKMHFMPQRSRYGFEHVTLHPDDYLWWLEDHGYGGAFRGHGLGGNEVYPAVSVTPDKYYHTTWSIDESVKFLDQRDPDNPFFLYLVFEAPHSPFDPPEPYDRMYDNFTIPEPVEGDWVENDNPACLEKRAVRQKFGQLTPEMIKEARRRYYGQISQIDYHLGRLFGALKTRGLDNNTAIVFTSDHGECLGDHGLFNKYCYLESAARVPLILRLPAELENRPVSQDRNAPVQTADITPTLYELAGLEQDSAAEGESLFPAINSAEEFRDRIIFGETHDFAAAIGRGYKYIYNRAGGTEHLFSNTDDADDLKNLSNDPECQEIKELLKKELITYLKKNNSGIVEGDNLTATPAEYDKDKISSANPSACRGPMRGGMGY
ncbi:MAG: sulfatase-like hydrolase/transferase [Planctomycetota bacterium]|jgi:arylsulfatase A-like enzyme